MKNKGTNYDNRYVKRIILQERTIVNAKEEKRKQLK